MKAVLFGAGSIGRGFIAELLTEAGLEVVFIDINKQLIDAINKQGCYRIVIVGNTTKEKIIKNVRAADCSDIQQIAKEFCDCDLVVTSVGAGVLRDIAPVIAQGLTKRWECKNHTPLNILICENLHDADEYLRTEILQHLPVIHHTTFEEMTGLLETSIGRMIPVVPDEIAKTDPTTVYVESYRYLPYDSAPVKGTMPHIPFAIPYTPFEYYIERKLFVHNMGHFICALFGQISGYTYIWEAINDPSIAYFVRTAMSYSALALSKKHSVDYNALLEHIEDLLYRFSNIKLGDTIERVMRDPERKLAPNERLYGAVKLCEEQNVSARYLFPGIAAAQCFLHDTVLENKLISELTDVLKSGFDFSEIQQTIQQYHSASEEVVI
jgi:mannitol-1-phosphate 5-dehydrogenase